MAQSAITWTGLAEFQSKLSSLPAKVEKRVLKQAGRRAMKPVLFAARENARDVKDTGALAAAFRESVDLKPRRGLVVRVGVDAKYTKTVDGVVKKPSKYSHLVELGTAPHGKHPGSAPHPLIRAAQDKHRTQVVNTFADEVVAGIEREMK